MNEAEAKLQPGYGFRLQPDGQWKVEKIPDEVLKEAKFSGYLTIQGYRSTVFETPEKEQWAQKSTGTVASRVAAISLTPDELLKTLYAQVQAFDINENNFISCSSPAIAAEVAKIKGVLAAHGVTQFLDVTDRSGRYDMPLVPDGDNIKLVVDLQFIDGDKCYSVEGAPSGFDQQIDKIFADVYSALGTRADKSIAYEIYPSVPSDPTDSLFWDGTAFTDSEEVMTNIRSTDPKVSSIASRVAAQWLEAQDALWKRLIQARTNAITSIRCATCKNFAWSSEMIPRLHEGHVHHPACPGIQTIATRVARKYLMAQNPVLVAKSSDIVSQIEKTFERDGDDKKYDAAILDFVQDASKLLPPLEETVEKAINEVMDIRSKIDHKHPKVKSVYVKRFIDRMDKLVDKLTAVQEDITADLGNALHKYEMEAKDVEMAPDTTK